MGTIAKRWCLRPGKRDGLGNVAGWAQLGICAAEASTGWAQLGHTDRLERLHNQWTC